MRYAPKAHFKKEGHQVFDEVPEKALAEGAKAEFRTASNSGTTPGGQSTVVQMFVRTVPACVKP